jgi:pyroglutamyl-peptidase
MRHPTILLTGFEPFGGESLNPSWQVAQALHGAVLSSEPGDQPGAALVQAVCLPCVFGQAQQVLQEALRRHKPVLVLALGQAGGREGFTVERVAINVDDARIADNAGQRPIDEAILPAGPAAYFSNLPIKAMVAALQQAGWPAAVSQTAGTYVCNHVFYGLMHALRRRRGVRGGFMHLPLVPGQEAALAGQPSLPLDVQTAGVRLALLTALGAGADLRVSGGAES